MVNPAREKLQGVALRRNASIPDAGQADPPSAKATGRGDSCLIWANHPEIVHGLYRGDDSPATEEDRRLKGVIGVYVQDVGFYLFEPLPDSPDNGEAWRQELRNIATVAHLIIDSAMARKESRGLHYTSDYPSMDESYTRDTVITRFKD